MERERERERERGICKTLIEQGSSLKKKEDFSSV
jgi:hypothetical protein